MYHGKLDLSGMRFGKLTAIEKLDEKSRYGIVWKCKCDCGKESIVPSSWLRSGFKLSCGCFKRGAIKSIKNLRGEKFGKLTAIEPTEKRRNRSVVWLCRCDCGNLVERSGCTLEASKRRKSIPNCGCTFPQRKLPHKEASLKALYIKYLKNAEKKRISFILSISEFEHLTSQNCYYCGTEPNQINSSSNKYNGHYIYNGIDRVDNTKGYTINNCVSCCKTCNYAKHTLSMSEFRDWINRLIIYQSNKEAVK